MPKPLIGLTSYAGNDKKCYELSINYFECVCRAGGIPLLIVPLGDGQMAPDWLDHLDGLVLTGGADLDPALYGEQRYPTTDRTSPERDKTEMALARQALEQNMPTLAICRGMQLLNVALGGTLHQHLPEDIGTLVTHRTADDKPERHSSRLVSSSRLASIFDANKTDGVSWHHQGIKKLAAGLTPVAYADDNLIEAVELDDHPWCIGVQWHPEMSAEDDAAQQRLFDTLVNAASK